MLLVLRALLVLGLVSLHACRREQAVKVKLGRGTGFKGKSVRLFMDPSVQPQIGRVSDGTNSNMSLSPWNYSNTTVKSRLPERIYHAHCLTSGCLSLQGEGEDLALEAKPIYYQVLVLHRVPRKGKKSRRKYDLKLGTEVISVGCTCVRPSVIQQP